MRLPLAPAPAAVTLRKPEFPAARRALAALLVFSTSVTAMPVQPAAAAPAPAAPGAVRLPSLGETASADLSVRDERRLGDAILREGRRDPAYLDDPILLEYVQSLWQPLLAAARARGDIEPDIDRAFAWEAFLVKDRSLNAFALPGGYVGVHLGLIAMTDSADALASVLAHELTHVSQRHIARSIAPQQQASLLAVAGLLLGIIAASRSGSTIDDVNAAIAGSQAVAAQGQINYTRAMEREADRVGFAILSDAGFNPRGATQMFERMAEASRLNDNQSFAYLRTHPLTVERIAEARNRTLLDAGPRPEPTLRHAVMQARARVLMDDGAQSLARLVSGESSSPLAADRVAAMAAGALAASRLNDHARAERLALEAREAAAAHVPRDTDAERALALMHAELRLARNDAAGAQALIQALPAPAQPLPGGDRPTLLLRVQADLDRHRAEPDRHSEALRQHTQALQTWVSLNPQDGRAWELLSQTASVLGLKLRSLRAGAEARAVLGDLSGAIDRLRVAQHESRKPEAQSDFIEASVIDVRLRQLVAQRRELQIEARGGR